MSSVNMVAREVAAKIVFYGPGLSGKTTTLRKIYETVKPAHRGEMMSLATEGDRTLFFDFLPVKVERVGDCAVRLALYTVPGQVFYNSTRKLVLQGADGVVFVADSQAEALDSNIESLKNLEENLLEQGIRLDRFPLVFQWNKRDLQNVLPVDELSQALNSRGAPHFETCAAQGRGVVDALKAITRLVIKDLRDKRVVPVPRAPTAVAAMGNAGPRLEDQIQEQLAMHPTHPPRPAATSSAKPRPHVAATSSALSCVSALAPSPLLDYARAAESAYAHKDFAGTVRAAQEAVRRGLAYAGEGTIHEQAYLLGIEGKDMLRLAQLTHKDRVQVDDAAFALFVLMQTLVRLADADLPPVG